MEGHNDQWDMSCRRWLLRLSKWLLRVYMALKNDMYETAASTSTHFLVKENQHQIILLSSTSKIQL